MAKRSRRSTVLDRLLSAGQTPLFVVSEKRRVVFFNEGCERLTGWTAGEIIGALCEFATEADPAQIESVTGVLCPPPEVFEGKPSTVPAYVTHRNGESSARVISFFPMLNGEGAVDSVVGIIVEAPTPKPASRPGLAQQLHAELAAQRALLRQRFGLKSIVARSGGMLRVLRQVHLARVSTAAVLILGEPGAGREHLARVIHHESEARSRTFVPLDCARLPTFELKPALRRLLAGESAEARHDAPLPAALQAGTVYLANVESMPRDVQQFLVELIVAGGAARPVRFVASARGDLRDAVARDEFLTELCDLLATIVIDVPPLRRRRDELPLLAQAFLEDCNRGSEKQVGGFSDDVRRQFHEYNWPGNLDELSDVVREAHANCMGSLLLPADLPFRFRSGMDAQSQGADIAPHSLPLEKHLETIEKSLIEQTLEQSRHNKARAAEILGIPRPRLYRRMQALGIADAETDEPPKRTPDAETTESPQ